MNTRTLLRQHGVALRAMLVFTLVLGVAYTAVITGVGQLALGGKADGSAVALDGETVGSSLIGQSFTDADGAALPEWFQSRPSAAGDGYDASASSGSNYGPENEDLIAAIDERRAAIAASDGVAPEDVPVDALTASSSGLDPHISPEYAQIQIERVAAARDLPLADVEALVAEHTRGRDLGYLGEPTVNVLELNTALAATSR
ncbi:MULTISPECIES: potassium-transporting ATPase subunit KdpC [Frigoribacterium]|uniref:potassium-transporting ATPase subunit KdpC n=1 Tax=Frigoribacterium TaxID=96492 RepID=UPI00177F730A|nr:MULTISPECIES: potassium-transporting ATPase subunit KdpC [Frigoribacterium]MBD8702866.1 potassium-transporting ATPase subunit KdpC [Frigoribacterium sp. CFBP 13712]MCJ0700643.1 potassium-transporting ATPase subunit KdpC [Frigoribacterium faeni]